MDATRAASPRRRCASCGAELRLSHREYAGRGTAVTVHRCSGCGALTRGAALAAGEAQRSGGRRTRQGFDEGAPANPVIDPETAARLFGEGGDVA